MPRYSLTILPLLLSLILPTVSTPVFPRAAPPFKLAVVPSSGATPLPLYFTQKGTITTTKQDSPICYISGNNEFFCGDYQHPLGLPPSPAAVLKPCSDTCETKSVRINPDTLNIDWAGNEFWYVPGTEEVWISKLGSDVIPDLPTGAVKADLKTLFN